MLHSFMNEQERLLFTAAPASDEITSRLIGQQPGWRYASWSEENYKQSDNIIYDNISMVFLPGLRDC